MLVPAPDAVLAVVAGTENAPLLTAPVLSSNGVLSGVSLIVDGEDVLLSVVAGVVTPLELSPVAGDGELSPLLVVHGSVEVDELVVQGSIEVEVSSTVVVQVVVEFNGRGWLVTL